MGTWKTAFVCLICITAATVFNGCAVVHLTTHSKSKLLKLQLGMSQEEVRARMGKPSEAAAWREDGTEVVVDSYRLYPATDKWRAAVLGQLTLGVTWCIIPSHWGDTYHFYYSDGYLDRYGYPAPDRIEELRIR